MDTERVTLHGVAQTMLMTLWFRAHDARSAHPILGDPYAEDLVARIDPESSAAAFTTASWGRGNAPIMAARGRRLDVWTQGFLDAHPEGQVLHLGCGLDSRPLRVHRPSTSRWLDVDQPEVIDLRRRLYDLPADVVTVPASVTDPGWWEQVEPGRRTLIVAEGLLMYLPGAEVHALVDRALERLASGELAFDGVASWVLAVSRVTDPVARTGVRFSWALEDLSRRHPVLTRVDDRSVTDLIAEDPAADRLLRLVYGGVAWVPPVRGALRLQRLRFG